jgi:hypothetical protein
MGGSQVLPRQPIHHGLSLALEWIAPYFGNGGVWVASRPLAKLGGGSPALPLEERIRERAHELYIERGNESGSEMDDWLQAEEELSAEQEERMERD